MMSGLSAAAWIERSVRLEQRPQMFDVHIIRDGEEELLVGVQECERSKERKCDGGTGRVQPSRYQDEQ